ncbi:hypothetical protein EVAR_51017_1 [Eumeta japonica]|uniref:Uncharacterized protein n=1 Tax=Eumeta variegata TaxID=151549 RepID=A0A4C1Y496_EUMVA|nr:hypothetical protein EVAR_51017_1 [Eumeta japonica]
MLILERNGWTDFDAVFKNILRQVRSCQLSQTKRSEPRHRHRFTEFRNKITAFLLVDQRAVDLARPSPFFHVATCYIRICFSSASIYADADADLNVEIDADVPHVRMRMRIFATSLVQTSDLT